MTARDAERMPTDLAPQKVAPHASSRHGDDREEGRKGVEPAMAGIPAGAVQMMPEVGIPGLPPVDPVEPPFWRRPSERPPDTRSPHPPAPAAMRGNPLRARFSSAGTGTAASIPCRLPARFSDASHQDRRNNPSLHPAPSDKDCNANLALVPARHPKDWMPNPCFKYLRYNTYLPCDSTRSMAREVGDQRDAANRPRLGTT